MRKVIKIVIGVLLVLVLFFIVDTLQARIFNNKPILSRRVNNNLEISDKGILVNRYNCINGDDQTYFIWEKKKCRELFEVPDGYSIVFHGEDGDVVNETYIYKIPNDMPNYGFNYVNVTKTKKNDDYVIKITGTGSVDWTDNCVGVASRNNALSYVTLGHDDEKMTVDEFLGMFLMN